MSCAEAADLELQRRYFLSHPKEVAALIEKAAKSAA
jgi:hypothetical protein